jgi:tRNA(adenine34) deaminase
MGTKMEKGSGEEMAGAGSYETYMALALTLAASALDQGEFPVGCIIVQEDRVAAQGARTGTRQSSEGRLLISEVDHAEILALKQLALTGTPVVPEKCTLFCTMEPCLMCYGAIILSGIKTIVYAFEDPMGGGTGCDLAALPPLYRNSRVRTIAGVCRQKSLDLFFEFFNKRASTYWKDSFLDRYVRDQKQRQGK